MALDPNDYEVVWNLEKTAPQAVESVPSDEDLMLLICGKAPADESANDPVIAARSRLETERRTLPKLVGHVRRIE